MPRVSKRVATLAVLAIAAGGLAACSSTSSNTGSSTAPTSATSGQKPQSGGTLNIVAASGPDHIDTVPAYYTPDYELERVYTRQLVSYPTVPAATTTSAGWTTDTTPVPDVATAVPTTANGGITGGGTTYTFHIKPGVDWNTTPARQVTAQDFIREFKAFFNPVSPVGNPAYYTSTIAGPEGVPRRRDRVLRERQDARADRGEHRDFPEHAQHQRACPRRTRSTMQFKLIGPGQRLHLHDGDAVHLGPPGRVRRYVPNTSSWTSTRSPTARTRSARTSPASRSRWSATRPGSSRPTRCGTTTWTDRP